MPVRKKMSHLHSILRVIMWQGVDHLAGYRKRTNNYHGSLGNT